MKMRLALALSAMLSAACGGSPTSPGDIAAQPAPAAPPFQSTHFTFFPTSLDAGNIAAIADSLEREYARITQDLGVNVMPRVNVHFYADHSGLASAVAPVIGPIPSWASGAATGAGEIHLISPNHPAFAPYNRMVSNLVHEFGHCVSLAINPRIGNNPRWFWESVAIYESGQFVEPRTLPYMVQGNPPPFTALNSFDNTLVYDVGYTIGVFIVARSGQRALADLIVNNANVAQTMGVSQATFEREWFAFVRERYQNTFFNPVAFRRRIVR